MRKRFQRLDVESVRENLDEVYAALNEALDEAEEVARREAILKSAIERRAAQRFPSAAGGQ